MSDTCETGLLIRAALPTDREAWLPLARDFCANEHIDFDPAQRRRVFDELCREPALGDLLLAEQAGSLAGFALVGIGYSAEYGGRFALLDELFVVTTWRGRRVSAQLIEAVRGRTRQRGLSALRLEVTDGNDHATGVYLRQGFAMQPRRMMTAWIAPA